MTRKTLTLLVATLFAVLSIACDGSNGGGSDDFPIEVMEGAVLDDVPFGGDPDEPRDEFELTCDEGSVLVGMDYNITASNGFINGMRIICAEGYVNGNDELTFGDAEEGDQVGVFDNISPAFSVCSDISGVNGYQARIRTTFAPLPGQGTYIVGVALSCVPVRFEGDDAVSENPVVGPMRGTDIAAGDPFADIGLRECPDGQLVTSVTGIQATDGKEFRTIGMTCSSLSF